MSPGRLFPNRTSKNRAGLLYSLFYSGQFILLGVQLPFFAGWLTLKGFSAPEIGVLTAAALIARLALGPFVAFWADHQDDERRALVMISAVFAIGGAGLVAAPDKALIAASAFLVLWAFGMLVPLTDAAVVRADRNGWLQYGRVRASGSFVFLVTTILGGAVFSRTGVAAAAPAMAAAALFAFLTSFLLPPQAGDRGGAKPVTWREAPRLLARPMFVIVLLSAGLTQGAHAVYYAFSYLRWSAIGYSDLTIGFLWATGVIAEIVVLVAARRLVRRRSPAMLLAVGGAAAAARWALTAAEPPLAILFLIQTTHAFTFAAAYLGSIEFIDRAIPVRLSNTAMTLMSATGVGALTGLATAAAGFIWAGAGPAAAYYLMSAMGVAAFVLALIIGRKWSGGLLFS
jgi:PPP family 3-phenylpropionic acid transporter